MARKSRISVLNGICHVTSCIVNREMWLKDEKVKDDIVGWLYATARFSGVDILSWTIMDNHFHLFVHVPTPQCRCNTGIAPTPNPLPTPSACFPPNATPLSGVTPPETDFMLSDDEMLERLNDLYQDERLDWKASLAA